MREAIGGTWIFQIVILFILLFTGYMCLSINQSKAFNVKNSIIKTIEREEGVDLSNPDRDSAIQQIVSYLKETAYRTTGKCPDEIRNKNSGQVVAQYHGYTRDGKIANNSNAAFCIAEVTARSGSDMPSMRYYRVVVFYQLDLPIFRNTFQFRISGDTKILKKTIGA